MPENYWLIKSEPSEFSIQDLKKKKTTHWDGVRNYQARNYIKQMKKGDKVIFYHSSTDPAAAAGICEVSKEAYADHTQYDPEDKHFYPSARPGNPVWFMMDVKFVKEFKKPVLLNDIRSNPKLKNMKLVQKGNRLSVMPVTKDEFLEILKMSEK